LPAFRFDASPESDTLVLPVLAGADPDAAGRLAVPAPDIDAEVEALAPSGAAGDLETYPRPRRRPSRVLLAGIGDGGEAGWRAAGAAVARSRARGDALAVGLPADVPPAAVRGFTEGLILAAYRFRMASRPADDAPPALSDVVFGAAERPELAAALDAGRATADATILSRDLTNMPSNVKSPQWFAERVGAAAAAYDGLTLDVREPARLAAEGFGGLLAVGGGSPRGPRLVELAWNPDGARRHVVLVGKGITFDSGGISIKPRDAMKLMRKDMGGAASVVAAVVGAAALGLPVRVTALAPLAENMPGGSAFRPGDVVRHYGGLTSESTNTDAEGRLVLADALAYAVAELAPDVLIDMATLTGANAVALGKRTAGLYCYDDGLAAALADAADRAGESVWRMPLVTEYLDYLTSDIADYFSCPEKGAGSVVAALYLGEFTGSARDRWAHIDMSAPAWADADAGELSRGATGWGVRTLLRWLAGGAERPTGGAERPTGGAGSAERPTDGAGSAERPTGRSASAADGDE
jgi:leucyl aminopeptidase